MNHQPASHHHVEAAVTIEVCRYEDMDRALTRVNRARRVLRTEAKVPSSRPRKTSTSSRFRKTYVVHSVADREVVDAVRVEVRGLEVERIENPSAPSVRDESTVPLTKQDPHPATGTVHLDRQVTSPRRRGAWMEAGVVA